MYPPPPPIQLPCTCAYSLAPCPVHGTNCLNSAVVIPVELPNLTPLHRPGMAPVPAPLPVVLPFPMAMPAPVPAVVAKPAKRINVRQKGQRGEREVVDLLQDIVDEVRARYRLEPIVLQRNALQAHLGGADLHGLDGFSVEVKFQEIPYSPAWWRQAVAQSEKTKGVPILFYRMSRQPWTVMMRVYVNTPGDRDQVEMDVTITLADFTEWFKEAYDEACVNELQNLS